MYQVTSKKIVCVLCFFGQLSNSKLDNIESCDHFQCIVGIQYGRPILIYFFSELFIYLFIYNYLYRG